MRLCNLFLYSNNSVCVIGKIQKQPPEVFCNAEAWNFIKKETLTEVFSCEFFEISKNTFFTELLRVTASKDCKN